MGAHDLPIRKGAFGPGITDIQRRLSKLGYSIGDDNLGYFGPGTAQALASFQADRGLRVDSVCGPETWASLVEAGWQLGDRLLYLRNPMMRGDDVAELQRRLNRMGFDTGRVDGIYGDQTAEALAELQRNVGLEPDGILGPVTMREIERITPRYPQDNLVSSVRDREWLDRDRTSTTAMQIAIGYQEGMGILFASLRRRLASTGIHTLPLHCSDDHKAARLANSSTAQAYLAFRALTGVACCDIYYYSGYRYESLAGKYLAELLDNEISKVLDRKAGNTVGMALPILRETRMPAVLCEIGPPALLASRASQLADAVLDALLAWLPGMTRYD